MALELDENENRNIKTDPFGIEQNHAALDDTGILHLANAPPAG
ncbi:MAG: hypothetical protein R3D34_14110 [Nitratireductor sp.]